MEQKRLTTAPRAEERENVSHYLNHGVESLVALDNPDDSQLGAEHQPGKTAEPKPS